MRDQLLAKITERERRLSALDDERIVLDAEIRAYKDALNLLSQNRIERDLKDTKTQSAISQESRRPRRLFSGGWAEILWRTHRENAVYFGTKEIMASAERIGIHIDRMKSRSQLADYVNSGYLLRLDPGKFCLTPIGLSEIERVVQQERLDWIELSAVESDHSTAESVGDGSIDHSPEE